MLENNYGYIYRITNKLNNKFYIGKRTCKADEKQKYDYMSSCIPLVADIKRYGKENFTKEIIKWCEGPKSLTYFEAYYQFTEKVLHPETNSYNGNILGKFFKRDSMWFNEIIKPKDDLF